MHPMVARADAATLNVQPRQRRRVYTWLADAPTGRSVKHLLDELDIPEPELRETLRKLDAAGLARRTQATWVAIPLEQPEPRIPEASDAPSSRLAP
jgi:predicted ArsR family transcriptional regulator